MLKKNAKTTIAVACSALALFVGGYFLNKTDIKSKLCGEKPKQIEEIVKEDNINKSIDDSMWDFIIRSDISREGEGRFELWENKEGSRFYAALCWEVGGSLLHAFDFDGDLKIDKMVYYPGEDSLKKEKVVLVPEIYKSKMADYFRKVIQREFEYSYGAMERMDSFKKSTRIPKIFYFPSFKFEF